MRSLAFAGCNSGSFDEFSKHFQIDVSARCDCCAHDSCRANEQRLSVLVKRVGVVNHESQRTRKARYANTFCDYGLENIVRKLLFALVPFQAQKPKIFQRRSEKLHFENESRY